MNAFTHTSLYWTAQDAVEPQRRKALGPQTPPRSLLDAGDADSVAFPPLIPAPHKARSRATGKPNWAKLDAAAIGRIVAAMPRSADQLVCAKLCSHWHAAAHSALLQRPQIGSVDAWVRFVGAMAAQPQNAQRVRVLALPPAVASGALLGDIVLVLERCPRLRVVELPDAVHGSNLLLEALAASCAHLERLVLRGCALSDRFLVALGDQCPLLRHINVAQCDGVTLGSLERLLAAPHCALRSADWSGCALGDAGSFWRAPGARITALESLVLGQSQIDDASLASLVRRCPNIEQLDLSGCGSVSQAALIQSLRALPRLTEVNLAYCPQVSDMVVGSIPPCAQTVVLSGCTAVTPTAAALLAARCRSLERLDLSDIPAVANSLVRRFASRAESEDAVVVEAPNTRLLGQQMHIPTPAASPLPPYCETVPLQSLGNSYGGPPGMHSVDDMAGFSRPAPASAAPWQSTDWNVLPRGSVHSVRRCRSTFDWQGAALFPRGLSHNPSADPSICPFTVSLAPDAGSVPGAVESSEPAAASRGKQLLRLRIDTWHGDSIVMAIHEFDNPMRLASDFVRSHGLRGHADAFSRQLAHYKSQALRQRASASQPLASCGDSFIAAGSPV